MAITETRPEAAEQTAAPAQPAEVTTPEGGLVGLLGTGDHRNLGRLWTGTSVLYLLFALVLAGLLGIERLDPTELSLFGEGNFNQVFSLQSVATFFLFLLPALIGVATIVVPPQVGAKTVAFPRAAAAAYWTYLVSGGLVVAAYAINGGPFGGEPIGVDLFLAALALEVAALVLGSICIATTVLALRAPGLTLARTPAFAWSMLVAATIWIASLGLLFGLLVLLYLDQRYDVRVFGGQGDQIENWLRWAVTPPQVFSFAIPVLGFAADVVPVFTGTRQRFHGVVLGAIGAFGALSFGAWTFYGFTVTHARSGFGAPELTTEPLYIAFAVAGLLPVLIVLGGVADSFVRGRGVRAGGPLLFAVGGLVMVLAGAAAGAVRVIERLELVNTTADGAVAGFVFGAGVLTVIGALHYWWPQSFGRPLNAGLGYITSVLLLLGTLAFATPDLVSGVLDQNFKSLMGGEVRDGIEALNGLSLVGAALLLLGVLVFVANVVSSLSGREATTDADPWGGHTLEWAEDPAAVTVESATPLLDQREKEV